MKKNDISELIALKEGTDTFLGIIKINDILSKPEEEQLALIMKREIPVINKKDSIEKAISFFLSGDYSYLPVVEDSNVIGIIALNEMLPLINKKYKIKKRKDEKNDTPKIAFDCPHLKSNTLLAEGEQPDKNHLQKLKLLFP